MRIFSFVRNFFLERRVTGASRAGLGDKKRIVDMAWLFSLSVSLFLAPTTAQRQPNAYPRVSPGRRGHAPLILYIEFRAVRTALSLKLVCISLPSLFRFFAWGDHGRWQGRSRGLTQSMMYKLWLSRTYITVANLSLSHCAHNYVASPTSSQ